MYMVCLGQSQEPGSLKSPVTADSLSLHRESLGSPGSSIINEKYFYPGSPWYPGSPRSQESPAFPWSPWSPRLPGSPWSPWFQWSKTPNTPMTPKTPKTPKMPLSSAQKFLAFRNTILERDTPKKHDPQRYLDK